MANTTVNGAARNIDTRKLMKPMFITVKYGDNQEAIFNPWCHSYILLDCIREKCQCDKNATIDLVDAEGTVSELHNKTTEYANDYVTPRETYVLIQVEKQDGGKPCKYTSLLHDLDRINPDLLAKLNNISRKSSSRHHRGHRAESPAHSGSPVRRDSASSASWGNLRKKINVTRALKGAVTTRKNSQSGLDGRRPRLKSDHK